MVVLLKDIRDLVEVLKLLIAVKPSFEDVATGLDASISFRKAVSFLSRLSALVFQ